MKTTDPEALPLRLSQRHRLFIYAIGGSLVASGVGWLIAHYFLSEPNELGETHHPSEPVWLRIHGAALFCFLVLLGTILPGHVTRAWSMRRIRTASVRRNVITGIVMLSLVGILALTGYGLYYSGSEELRPYISATHWMTGLAAAVGFYQHHKIRSRRVRVPHTTARPIEPLLAEQASSGAGFLEQNPHQPLS